jgi:hypothetical protein
MPFECAITRADGTDVPVQSEQHILAMIYTTWMDTGRYTIKTLFPLDEQKEDDQILFVAKLHREYPNTPIPITPAHTFLGVSYPVLSTCDWANHSQWTVTGEHQFKLYYPNAEPDILQFHPGDIFSGGRYHK